MKIEELHWSSALLLSLLLAVGCGSDHPIESPPPPPYIAAITVMSGDNQTATVATPLVQPPTVRVSDQRGASVAHAMVSWTITSGGGMVDHSSSLTGSEGTASARWTLGTQVGTNSLSAASGSLPPVTFTATATAGPLTSITIAPPGTPVETGDVLQLSTTAVDAYQNPVPLPTLRWASSNAAIARVTADGFLVALAPGTASISASGGDVRGSLTLAINPGITFSFGAEETVFAWSTDHCNDYDLPDVPAHVVRVADGSLVLMASDAPKNYVMVGSDFSSLHRICSQPALISGDNYYPETYDNQEWIHSIYRQGAVIHALITNEYHDPFAFNCAPGYTLPGNPCWYNSITYAFSTDGGLTFTHATPPAHVVAPPWQLWDPEGTPYPYGYFFPSSIVLGADDFYYSVFMSWARNDGQALCMMRTHTLGDPASWRTWDGTGFNLQMTSPYAGAAPASCGPVINAPDVVGQPTLTYNTYLGKYMIIGGHRMGGPTEFVCGFFYSLSSDLINWTPMRLLRTAYVPWSSECFPPGVVGSVFPSIIDHNDVTPNFERPGRTPHLYYTRFNDQGLNRDLVRVPMTITAH